MSTNNIRTQENIKHERQTCRNCITIVQDVPNVSHIYNLFLVNLPCALYNVQRICLVEVHPNSRQDLRGLYDHGEQLTSSSPGARTGSAAAEQRPWPPAASLQAGAAVREELALVPAVVGLFFACALWERTIPLLYWWLFPFLQEIEAPL